MEFELCMNCEAPTVEVIWHDDPYPMKEPTIEICQDCMILIDSFTVFIEFLFKMKVKSFDINDDLPF